MDDSYWTHVGETHHIDLEVIRRLAFRLLSMFEASESLLNDFEYREAEAQEEGEVLDPESESLLALHNELITSEASKTLLEFAMLLRVYDDQLKNGLHATEYKRHVQEKGGDGSVGARSDGDRFNYRDACNKIIHALRLNPLRDRYERDIIEGQDLWYLTGEIEMTGEYSGNEWNARLDVQSFVGTVLDVIAFGDPDLETE